MRRWMGLSSLALLLPALVQAQIRAGYPTAGAVPVVTVGTLPASPSNGWVRIVTDGADESDCTTGGGAALVLCEYDSTAAQWGALGDGAGTTPTLDQVFDQGATIDGANSAANSVKIGASGTGRYLCLYDDATVGRKIIPCDSNGTLVAVDNTSTIFTNQVWEIVDAENSNNPVFRIDPNVNGLGDGTLSIKDTVVLLDNSFIKRTPVEETLATYTMLRQDCGNVLYNDDADALEIDLIADPTGCIVCIFDHAGGAITLDPNGTDAFTVSGLAPAAGEALILASGVGNNVCLAGKDAATWAVFLGTGTVTEETP